MATRTAPLGVQVDKIVWWVIGALGAIILLVFSAGIAASQTRNAETARDISSVRERLSAVEANQKQITARIESMDTKLDRLIDLQARAQLPQRNTP